MIKSKTFEDFAAKEAWDMVDFYMLEEFFTTCQPGGL